ncbi:hypothetical protein MKW94_017449 [Papaver nudicaule]|uniref:Ureidoglycolate hydrolase n=1 Tax=Papaver nudicaule TaxID=74823 RepID=A0AA41UYH9_PAPNU|nr:hypothetical protein [Papaver nudicaule]
MASMVKLPVIDATPINFADFGQVCEALPDDGAYGPRDAELDLSHGIPRLYILHLERKPFKFTKITHHANVTQCLGSIGGHNWYLGVSKASVVKPDDVDEKIGKKIVKSKAGHSYVPPPPESVHIFRFSGPKFVKLHVGTWHVGPLFKVDCMDFYCLELSNTNEVDHTMHNFKEEDGVVFSFDDQV